MKKTILERVFPTSQLHKEFVASWEARIMKGYNWNDALAQIMVNRGLVRRDLCQCDNDECAVPRDNIFGTMMYSANLPEYTVHPLTLNQVLAEELLEEDAVRAQERL